jgi:hypothetical protein
MLAQMFFFLGGGAEEGRSLTWLLVTGDMGSKETPLVKLFYAHE